MMTEWWEWVIVVGVLAFTVKALWVIWFWKDPDE